MQELSKRFPIVKEKQDLGNRQKKWEWKDSFISVTVRQKTVAFFIDNIPCFAGGASQAGKEDFEKIKKFFECKGYQSSVSFPYIVEGYSHAGDGQQDSPAIWEYVTSMDYGEYCRGRVACVGGYGVFCIMDNYPEI